MNNLSTNPSMNSNIQLIKFPSSNNPNLMTQNTLSGTLNMRDTF